MFNGNELKIIKARTEKGRKRKREEKIILEKL